MAINFIKSYNIVENTYFKYQNSTIPMDDETFTTAFFECFDFLSALSKEEIDMLKSDLNLHCKLVMFDTIKLMILAQNPKMLHIPGFYKNFSYTGA